MSEARVNAASDLDTLVATAAKTVINIAPQLPTQASLGFALADAERAQQRGYFLPDEDERIRTEFAKYLHVRACLKSTLFELTPLLVGAQRVPTGAQPKVFLVTFCAACMLIRSARFITDSFQHQRVVWKKLDEAEPAFGIPRKRFTHIYRSLTSPRNVMLFLNGLRYQQQHQSEIEQLADDPLLGDVVQLLRDEQPYIETSFRYYARGRLLYRLHSFLRRNHSAFKNVMFAVFKWSGSLIAEMRDMQRAKRVTPAIRTRIATMLEPGDIIITRHDDAASNLFLPGFWPHAALYIGTDQQRAKLSIEVDAARAVRCRDPICVLEARKDGVLFRPLEDTLGVDCCTVIRPRLAPEDLRTAISRAITHEGKGYDFEFDFRRSDKLVCTEVAYRAFHGVADMQFELKPRAGRVCLSAEDLLDHARANTFFDVMLVFGTQGETFFEGAEALPALRASYQANASGPSGS